MARRNGSRAGGDRPGAGRPKGSSNESTLGYRHAYVQAVHAQARRAWEEERRQAKEAGRAFTTPKPVGVTQEDAIAYLTRVKFVAIARALANHQYQPAIMGLESIENRMLGKCREEMLIGGVPDAPPIAIEGTNAAPIELVFTLGDATDS